jgi:hypothetical protein
MNSASVEQSLRKLSLYSIRGGGRGGGGRHIRIETRRTPAAHHLGIPDVGMFLDLGEHFAYVASAVHKSSVSGQGEIEIIVPSPCSHRQNYYLTQLPFFV